MRSVLGILVPAVICTSAFAQQGEFERRSRVEMEAISQRLHQAEENQFMAESQEIANKLAVINNTNATFNPNVRNSPAGEDLVAGEWLLGNGGVCVRGVWTNAVFCKGAKGFIYRTSSRRRRH